MARSHLYQQAFLPFLFQLKAFKDEEKVKEALKQQKRKMKVSGLREEQHLFSCLLWERGPRGVC